MLAAKQKYYEKPCFRRATTCEAILAGSVNTMCGVWIIVLLLVHFPSADKHWDLLANAVGFAFLCFVGAVLFVCCLTLTGPIYKPQLDFKSGEIETWGYIEKSVAAVISILITLAAVLVAQRFVL
jgi:hypothetical protein